MSAYAELAVTTNFSFLRGASHPREMVETADELGQIAIGIADRNSFAGVVRAYDEAKNRNIKLMVGTRLVTTDGFEVLAYPTDRAAYGRLCRLLTAGNLAAKKGECHLTFEQILGASEGQMLIAIPPVDLFSVRHPEVPALSAGLRRMRSGNSRAVALRGSLRSHLRVTGMRLPFLGERLNNSLTTPPLIPAKAGIQDWAPAYGAPHRANARWGPRAGTSGERIHSPPASPPSSRPRRGARFSPASIIIAATSRAGSACSPSSAKRCGAPLVAVNDALYHVPERRPLADVLTCIREKCTIAEAGLRLSVNAERHLKSPAEMARLFARFPGAIARTIEIAEACRFSLDELKYEYPDEPVPPGKTAAAASAKI